MKMAAEHQNGDSHSELDIANDLTYELAREIMQALIDALSEPENVKMLKEIRDDCKNDALRVMVYVYPQVVSIKIKAIEKYGVHGAQGLIRFITHIKEMMKLDPELLQLYRQLQAKSFLFDSSQLSSSGSSNNNPQGPSISQV
ncbi:uncharacterized protein LOC132202447 [Neocloeon triangulifer]|uniref:uncharacterized protein LOC132202447 n=1 Tax=Neocloeon triangulifer TaxID=2078957 RepID=UPI00286F3B31|nr:uncharacterized protein LOC132202447 [Neocloeon triangulifer]